MSTPLLRFKEFHGDWQSVDLGKITQTLTSGSRDWAQHYSKTGSKFIRMTNLSRVGIQLKLDDLRFVDVKSDSSDGQRTNLVHGDILISITAELGKIGWIPPNFGEAYINQHTALVRLKKTEAESRFIAHLLSTSKQNKQLNRMNDSGAKAGLNLPTIKSIRINIPAVAEQTKIANFLTAVDEKISQLTQKCELLTQYKKGVMQKIFSQALRFKDDDGRNFPDWREREIKDIAEINPKSGALPEEFLYVDLESVEKGILLRETMVQKDAAPSRAQRLLRVNDVLFQMVRPYQRNNLLFQKTGDYVASTGYAQLRAKENPSYLYHFLHLDSFISEVMNRCTGTSYPAINSNDLATILISLPTPMEQTKIANVLTAIDEKITNAQAQLAAAKQYKQGLLQQMFV